MEDHISRVYKKNEIEIKNIPFVINLRGKISIFYRNF